MLSWNFITKHDNNDSCLSQTGAGTHDLCWSEPLSHWTTFEPMPISETFHTWPITKSGSSSTFVSFNCYLKIFVHQVTIFKSYTEENCLLECRAKHLLRLCGCLPYYYPRLDLFLHAKNSINNNDDDDVTDFEFGNNSSTSSGTVPSSANSSTTSACDYKGLMCLSEASGKTNLWQQCKRWRLE